MAGLTIPVECLSFEEHPLTDSRFLKKEFAGHLSNAKETFLDFTATKVLIDYIKLQHENNVSYRCCSYIIYTPIITALHDGHISCDGSILQHSI